MVRNKLAKRSMEEPAIKPFTWEEVKANEAKPGILLWFILLFVPWTDVYSSIEDSWPCELTSLDGRGCWQYKRFMENSYYVRVAPSPGFPGN